MIQTSKDKLLKKALIKNAVIMGAVVVVLTGMGIGISSYDDSVLSDLNLKQSQNNILSSEYREIETNLGLENEVAKYYDTYTKNHNKNFAINRDVLTDLLTSLRKTHHLSSHIEVTVSPISEVPDNTLSAKSGKVVKSNVRISLGAVTDNSIYNFISDLEHKLPGIVLVSEFKITRGGDLTRENVTQAMSQHILTPLVTGEVSFVWVGIAPSENTGTK